jgi:filamentous hemagglutinin
MDNAANGVPVVNINDPNSVGVSHNKFLDYNVGTSGAIINNSQSNAVSELGGVVLGNSNLHNSATTIINEVTSTSRSTINGPQEILGGKADYILANPNGISINGGEFVNAHRATVTTGRVQLDSFGSLEKIYVEKGNIEFTDRDLDVSNLDYFDIIARTTELKVKIHGGRELRVITGRGEYDVKNDKFKSNETYSSAPSVAIDSSKLGGLYAGKIKLVSNEDGVGVNAPDIESSIGDIEITSSGKIVHRHVKSNANIRLKSKNDGIVVTSGSKSSAARNISYNTKEAITIEDGSILVTTENIDLNSSSGKLDNKGRIIASGHGNINIIGHSVSNQGIVAASHLGNIAIASVGSIDNSGKLASKGGLISLTYKDDFSNGGTLYSKSGIKLNEGLNFKAASSSKIQTDGDFFVNVKGDIENEGKILLSGSGQFTAGGKFSNRGSIDSADRLKLVSGLESTNKGLLKAANSIMLDSKDDGITNSGKMVSGDIDLRAKGNISNSDLIESSVLKIVSDDGKLTNTGSIKSATTATIRLAKDFINDGLLIANDKIKITSIGGKISSDTKSDIISKQETIELDAAGNIVNFGHIEAAKDIMLKSKDNVTNEGVLLSGGAIAIAATNGINNELTATIKANEKVRLQSVGAFDNKGRIVALGAEGLELRAYSISNQGNIETKLGNAVIASLSSIDNRGNIGAWGSKLAFTYKDDFNNSGTLYAKTGIELDEGRSFKGEADSIITTDSRIDITTSGDIENKGKITSTESSQFKADGKFSNSGNVDSGDRIEVTSGLGLTNSGLLKATNNILLNSTRDVVNSGVMFGENHSVKIHSVAGEIANTGNIVSWDINLRARGDISNSDLIHSATLQIISDNGSLINNNGSINAENTATITLKKDFVNIGGLILANNKIKITSSGGLISNDGSSNILSIQDAVELEAGGNIVNTGHIEVAKDITVKSGANAVNAGIILAGGAIEIAATNGIENIETAKINAATTIKFESESYSNLGDVDAKGGDISFEVAGDVINGGHLKAEKNLTSVGSIGGRIRNAGEMLAGAGLDLRSRLGFENGIDAQVEAGLLLTLKSDGHLTNKGSILSVADRVDLDFAQSIENAGEISSADHLKIVGGSVFTNEGSVISEALLEIEVNDHVENWLGGHLESADNMTIKSRIGNVANRGEIISDKLLKLEALGFVDNGGLLQGEDGIAVLSERSNITNDGSITTKGNATFVAEQDFINTKQIDSVGNIAINSGLRVANSGVLAAKSNVDIDNVADFVNRGTVSATNLAITSGGGLSNTALLLAGGISTLTAQGDVQNIAGGTIDSTGKLTITSHNGKVTNINSDPGTYDKSGIIAKAALLIKSALGIENTDNHIESDGKIEVETAGYFSNTGNIVAAEALELRVDGAVSNSGEVQSIGALSLRAVDGYSPAESMVNNGLISAQDVSDIKVRDNIKNNRIIQAKNEVRLVSTGGTFTNKGPVLSILKDIKADIEGDIVNDGGTLESYDSVVLTSQEGSISNSGRIFSKNDKASLLAKKSIEHNAGIIFAPSDVAITSRQGAVTNRAIIESIAGDLSITADGLVSNYGLLKAAYGLKIDVDRGDFSNIDGKVLAGRVLEVTANTAGRDILNNRGYNVTRIDQGQIHHYMPTRVWEETGPEVNKGNYHRQKLRTIITKKSNYADTLVSVDPIAPVIFSRGNISTSAGVNLNNSAGVIAASNNINVAGTFLTNQDVPVLAHTYHEPRERSIDRQKKKDWKGKTSWTQWGPSEAPLAKFFTEVPINTIPSMIQAGGAISGNLSGAVTNCSLGSGGGKAVANAPSAIGHAAAGNYAAGSAAPGDGASTIAAYSPRLSLVSAQNLASNQPIASSIADTAIVKRGPSLAEISQAQSLERRGITASSRFGKTSLDTADLSKLAIDIASTYIPPIERAASREFVDQEIQSKSAISVGGAYSPSSMQDISWTFDDAEMTETVKGGEWYKPEKPGKYYIKETSPVFVDMSTYFSTDNFIKRIDGFEPKKQSSAQVHYGDSMKQMDIVRRQMIELTGLGFLDERVDYTTEMRNLYESGIRYGKDMKLAPGIALSQEHVDQLQDDMVWAEEIELRGTKVIIPRLYLGKSKRDQKASVLLAREIDISAGSITNTSSIVGQKVRLKAKGDIVNSDGGDIYASKALELDSVGSIRNIGSSIGSGGSGVLKAVGNIENITTSEQIGDDRNYFTKVGKMAKINMVGPLTMISMGDLINRGSAISSGDLRFAVGGNFTNESVALSEGTNASGKNYYHRTSSVAYKQGTINASGSVRGIVAGDFTLLGSRLNSGGDMSLSVGGNSYITSQGESQLVDSHSSHTTSGMFSDKKHVNSSQLLRETLSAASLTSGGKLSLDNEGDQVLVGAKLMGEKGLRLKGAKTSILASRLKEYSSEFRHDEGMWTNTTKSVGQSRGIHAHSELSSGGSGIEIESERVNIDMAAQAKPSWARHLEGRHGVVWNPLTDTNDSWHKSKTTMSAELTAVVGIAAGVATSWMGGWGMFAATPATTTVTTATAATAGNVLGAMGTAAGHSLMIGAASGGAVSVVNSGLNGRFAPDQMFAQLGKDLTSKESLKSLGLGALTAGIGAGFGESLGGALSEKWGIATKLAPGMDVGQRIGSLATQTVINSGVRTGLAGMSGEDIGHVWKSESLSSTLALGQSAIGDIGEKQKLAEGGLGKIAMHGTLGGLYSQAMDGSFASGAIGGGVGELVAKPIIESGGSSEIVKLVSTATMFGIGGSVGDIETSGKVGQSMVESNIFLHPKPTWEQEVLRQQQLKKAGEIATEYVRENPVEAASYAIDLATLGLVPELAIGTIALKKLSEQITKKTLGTVVKQGVKQPLISTSKTVQTVVTKIPKVVKGRGMNHPVTKEAQQIGVKAHKKLTDQIVKKQAKGKKWEANPQDLVDPNTGRKVIPDALTPSGAPVELKPRTSSGIKKGKSQLPKYERATGKKGRVIYYDPKKTL